VSRHKTIQNMLEEYAASASGTFSPQEIYTWFARHYPHVLRSSIGAHIQAATANATNRERNHPGYGSRTPLFERVSHGTYRRFAEGSLVARNPTAAISTIDLEPVEVPPAREEWSWEGNLQAAVVTYLAANGVSITRVASTATKEHGTDIEGIRAGVPLHVEVKGWPSPGYVDVARAAEQKKTLAPTQARVWFASGLMKVLQLRAEHPLDSVALALPDKPTYRRLFETLRAPVEVLHISLLWVTQDGAVTLDGWGRNPGPAPSDL
jgi:hypothetical protein